MNSCTLRLAPAMLAGILFPAPVAAQATPSEPARAVEFIENRGQWDGCAFFRADTGPMTTWLTARGWTFTLEQRDGFAPGPGAPPGHEPRPLRLRGVAVRMTFAGASSASAPRGEERLPGVRSYFRGRDRQAWITGVAAHSRVRYRGLYPGVDLVLREAGGHIEYDLVCAPGADLAPIAIHCEGQDRLRIADDGALFLETVLGPVHQPPPLAWHELPGGRREPVACAFVLLGTGQFGFAVPERQGHLPLVIDPGLVWSSYLGGSGRDRASYGRHGIAVAENGDVLVAGHTQSSNFPTTPGAYDRTFDGCTGPYCTYCHDAFVTRFSPDGRSVVWSTYLGGGGAENALAVVPIGSTDVVVAGWTSSQNFPVTPGAWDTTFNGETDGFVARLTWDGAAQSLVWSTFLGATGIDVGFGLVADATGALALAGYTDSASFPVTPNAAQPALGGGYDGFIAVLDATGSQRLCATFLGGSGNEFVFAIAPDSSLDLTVTGDTTSADFPVTPNAFQPTYGGARDGFVSRLDGTLSRVGWSTYLGGSGDENCRNIVVGPDGQLLVAGYTASPNFPVTPGTFQPTYGGTGTGGYGDGFVTRLDPRLAPSAQLTWSTYFGIAGDDGLIGLGVERSGFVTVAGWTDRTGFWTTPGAYDPSFNGGPWDGVVARFDPRQKNGAQLVYASYFGGSGRDYADALALDAVGNAVVASLTDSANYPTTPGVPFPTARGGSDVAVTVFDLLPSGVTRYGTSTPACAWPIYTGVNGMPAPGNQRFAILATGAAPNAVGAVLFGVPLPTASWWWFLNVLILQGPLFGISVPADANGFAELNVPVPASYAGGLPGLQWVFLTNTTCPGSGLLSASDGLK